MRRHCAPEGEAQPPHDGILPAMPLLFRPEWGKASRRGQASQRDENPAGFRPPQGHFADYAWPGLLIRLTVWGNDILKAARNDYQALVCSETLATESAREKTNGMSRIEAGDKTWEVKLARDV
jgi:hypothetical protein